MEGDSKVNVKKWMHQLQEWFIIQTGENLGLSNYLSPCRIPEIKSIYSHAVLDAYLCKKVVCFL